MDKHEPLTDEMLELVAEQFRALSEPSRLRLMNLLFDGETGVGELAERSGLSMANVSKHLALLYSAGFVVRRKVDVRVLYSLADARTRDLCNLMCARVHERATMVHQIARAAALPPRARARRTTR